MVIGIHQALMYVVVLVLALLEGDQESFLIT